MAPTASVRHFVTTLSSLRFRSRSGRRCLGADPSPPLAKILGGRDERARDVLGELCALHRCPYALIGAVPRWCCGEIAGAEEASGHTCRGTPGLNAGCTQGPLVENSNLLGWRLRILS
jgi:hypothetical protein